jgi:hypothetical protein
LFVCVIITCFVTRASNDTNRKYFGEIRNKGKTMKRLKRVHTTTLKGYQIYHNYIREHEALKGKTPPEDTEIIPVLFDIVNFLIFLLQVSLIIIFTSSPLKEKSRVKEY